MMGVTSHPAQNCAGGHNPQRSASAYISDQFTWYDDLDSAKWALAES